MSVLDIEAIKNVLPHRYPFLLVDRVVEMDENRILTLKNVTVNEEFFNGHFPGAAAYARRVAGRGHGTIGLYFAYRNAY